MTEYSCHEIHTEDESALVHERAGRSLHGEALTFYHGREITVDGVHNYRPGWNPIAEEDSTQYVRQMIQEFSDVSGCFCDEQEEDEHGYVNCAYGDARMFFSEHPPLHEIDDDILGFSPRTLPPWEVL